MTSEEYEKLLKNTVMQGIKEGIQKSLSSSYNNPLDKHIVNCIDKHSNEFTSLINEAITFSVNDEDFRTEVKSAVKSQLAKTLVSRMGGELEKQVNTLKSSPTTRARITLAIEEIASSLGK